MATDPNQILQQTVPTTAQPTAQQVPISQASSVLPAAQFPGVAQTTSPSLTQGQNLLSTASPGQATQPGLLAGVDPSLLTPYTQSLPYLAALEKQPQLTMPNLDDPTLSSIQQRLAALQQSSPMLAGKQAPHLQSQIAKTQAPMSPLGFAGAAATSFWQQEIVDPVNDYINTWKRDPKMGLLETLGGVALVGGIVGLEALTGGSATPFIFAALAATQAPSLINAWTQEVSNPSDQNLVKAVVSTGGAALAVGSPVRAFRGVKILRNQLEAQMAARQGITKADGIADLLVGTAETMRGQLRTGAPLSQQLETLDINNIDSLRDQLERRGASFEEGPAAELMRHAEALTPIRERLRDAREVGDDEEAGHALTEMKQYVKDNLRDPLLATAYHYLMLPSTPYAHVPVGAIEGVEAALQTELHSRTNAIYGLLRRMHAGIGLQSPSDAAQSDIASIKEAEAFDRAAGAPHDTVNRILIHWEAMKQSAGIKTDEGLESLYQALEEPDKWKVLSPAQQAFAQKIRDISDMMTTGELKFGTIAQPLQGRVGHYFTGPAVAEGKQQAEIEQAAKQLYTSSWLTRPVGSRSRFWKAAVDDEGNVNFIGKTRSQIVEETAQQRGRAEKGHAYRQTYNPNESQFVSWRRSFAQLTKRHKNDAKAAAVLDAARQKFGDLGAEIVQMKRSDLDKLLRARAPERELVTGEETFRRMVSNHVFRMQRAMYGENLHAHANLNLQGLKDLFGKLPMSNWGAQMALPQFKNAHNFPDILPATVWGGDEEAARRAGYFLVHPATGNSSALNYRPALYARGELANEIASASEKLTASEHQNGVLNALYKVNVASKRYIMYNPLYHGLNVAGRAIAFVLQDPIVAGSAYRAVGRLREDPAAYHDLLEEFSMSGGVHATQWNVADQLARLQREEDGQSRFPGALRTVGGALDNLHKDYLERGLWSAVDQLQLAGYLYSKSRFLERGIREFDARRLASVYANNLGGMVNPMYMSRLWRQMKGLVFFAPSYWSTFLHSLQSVLPGAARLSQALTQRHGGRFAGLATVPLRAIDNRSRIELVRAQRDWMVTYLASTAVSMDMMNVMFSGHHLWENEQGHEWDIDVTNLPQIPFIGGGGGTETTPSGEVRRAYITAMPFFRQGVDIGNAIGLGHDWGFGHVFGDKSWQEQDLMHKTMMMGGALLDGMRRTGSTKLGQAPQVGWGLLKGESLTSRLGEGTQVAIDRPAALLGLLPQGYQLERMWKMYQQAYLQYAPGTPEYNRARQQFKQQVNASFPNAVLSAIGFPSVYHMGVEKPLIDDSKYENWVQQRDGIHARLTQNSNAVLHGQMTPIEYARHKHEEMIRQNQLNADTWGPSSPGATLSTAYSDLSRQFGLDSPGLSDQDWFERYDAFLPAWEQLLQSASPSTRAAWWDHSTAQWTDADYLEAEARQLRDTLASSVDGQNGNYIRAYQNQLFRLKPTLTVAEYQDLENSDPYYSTYKTLLSEMGRTSALGAFVSAFSSPFSQTYVPPANLGLSAEDAQALAEHTGQIVVRPEETQQLAKQARQVGQERSVAEAGGQFTASPEFQQQEQQAIAAAQQAAEGQ